MPLKVGIIQALETMGVLTCQREQGFLEKEILESK